jgi:hypothetical protein
MVSSCEKSARSKVVDSQAYFLVVFLELRIVLEVVCRYLRGTSTVIKRSCSIISPHMSIVQSCPYTNHGAVEWLSALVLHYEFFSTP